MTNRVYQSNRTFSNIVQTPSEIFQGRLFNCYNSQNVINTSGRATVVTDLSSNGRNLAPVSTGPLIVTDPKFPVQYLSVANTTALTGSFSNNTNHTRIEIFALPPRIIGVQQIMYTSEYYKTAVSRRMTYVYTNGTSPDFNQIDNYDNGTTVYFNYIREQRVMCFISYWTASGSSKSVNYSILNFGSKAISAISTNALDSDTLLIGQGSSGNATGHLWSFFEHINVNGELTDSDIIKLKKYVQTMYQVSL